MKPDYQSRYTDLLTRSSDEALNTLVQELDATYTAPARPADLTWSAAQRHLTLVRNAGSSLRPGQPLRAHMTRGRKGAILLVAAVVAVVVLGATVLSAVGILRFQQSQPSGALLATDAQLLQQLLQDKGTPENIQQLLQSGQFTPVNLASHPYDLYIQKVYADANNVVLLYTVDMSAWNAATTCQALSSCKTEPVLTLKTATGQILPETVERANMGKELVYKNKLVALLAYYDASVIQGNPSSLKLTATLAKSLSPSQENVGEFTTPVHTSKKVLNLHLTTSSKGHALTLERVVITSTEARFYYSYNGLLASTSDSIILFADETVSIAGKTYTTNPFPSDSGVNTYGWFTPGSPSENYTSFHQNLRDQMGSWSFTERAVVDENLSGPPSAGKNIHYAWTFTFTVS